MKKKICSIIWMIFYSYPIITAGKPSFPIKAINMSSIVTKQISFTKSPIHPNMTNHQQAVKNVLKHSVFLNHPPESLAEGIIVPYDPIMIGTTAVLYSKLPKKDDSLYTTVELPALPDSDICPHAMRAFVKRSHTKNPYTFVIFPSAFTPWQTGYFFNEIIAILEKNFNDPNIIGFSGYLSTEFLENTCEKIIWDVLDISHDLHVRLKIYLSEISANPSRTGIISFSGGAGVATVMLGEDSSTGIFGLGGIAFSPTLHGQTVFYNLDSIKNIPHSDTLTTPSWDWDQIQMFFNVKNNSHPAYVHFMEFYKSDPQNVRERIMNELTFVKLQQTINSLNLSVEDIIGDFNYYNVFINTGVRQDYPNLTNPEDLRNIYETKINIIPSLEKISAPFLIYISQDDPIVSSYNDSGQPAVITKILENAQTNPYIMIFNPRYGGHNGALLEPRLDHLIQAMFLPPPQVQ